MKFSAQKSKLILILFVCFFVSACAMNEKIIWLDEKAGEIFKNDYKTEYEYNKNGGDQEKKDLSQAEKDIVENFLENNNLNRYGDHPEAMYAGGTPLFNEKTGESIDRFDYILNNHPEILNILK